MFAYLIFFMVLVFQLILINFGIAVKGRVNYIYFSKRVCHIIRPSQSSRVFKVDLGAFIFL